MVELRGGGSGGGGVGRSNVGRTDGGLDSLNYGRRIFSPDRQTRGVVLYQKENASHAKIRDPLAVTPAAAAVTHLLDLWSFGIDFICFY